MAEYRLILPNYLDDEKIEDVIEALAAAVNREVSKHDWVLEEIDI